MIYLKKKMNTKLMEDSVKFLFGMSSDPYQAGRKTRIFNATWKIMKQWDKGPVVRYQITEAGQSDVIEGRKWPPSYKISIKIMEETRKPSNHNFVVGPPFHKLSQHKFIMLFSYRWQYLYRKRSHKSQAQKNSLIYTCIYLKNYK